MSSQGEEHDVAPSKFEDDAMEVDDAEVEEEEVADEAAEQAADEAEAEAAAAEPAPPTPPAFPNLELPSEETPEIEAKGVADEEVEAIPRGRQMQKPFQPGQYPPPSATPAEGEVVLCWNAVGWVTMTEPGNLSVRFYDKNKYTQFNQREKTADAPLTMAALGRNGVFFAAGGEGFDDDTPLRVFHRPTQTWGSRPEWSYSLPPGERPKVLAVGDTFAACFTNHKLRIWSHSGLEIVALSLADPVVTAATYDIPGQAPKKPYPASDTLAYISQSTTDSSKYYLTVLGIKAMKEVEPDVNVVVTPGASITWMGWCDKPHEGMLAVRDSSGTVSLLTHCFGRKWVSFTSDDNRSLHLLKIRNKCMQGVVDPDPRVPDKNPQETVPLSMDVIGRGGLQKKYAEQHQHARLLAVSRKAEVPLFTKEVALLEKECDEAVFEMFSDALSTGRESTARALDLGNLLNYRETLEKAMRLALQGGPHHSANKGLYEKLSKIVLSQNFPGDKIRKCRLPAPDQSTDQDRLVSLLSVYRQREKKEAKAKSSFLDGESHPEPPPKRVRSEEEGMPPSEPALTPAPSQNPTTRAESPTVRAESPPRQPVPTSTPAKSPTRRGLGNFVAFSPHARRDPLQTTRCTMEQALDAMHGRVPVAPPTVQPDFGETKEDESERQAKIARRAERQARRDAKETRKQSREVDDAAPAPTAPEPVREASPAAPTERPAPLCSGWANPPPPPVPSSEEAKAGSEEGVNTPARDNGPAATTDTPSPVQKATVATPSPDQSTPCPRVHTHAIEVNSQPGSRSSNDEGTPGPAVKAPPARMDGMAKLLALRRAKPPARPVQPAFSDGSLAEVKVPEREKAAVPLATVSHNLSAARDAARRAQAADSDSDTDCDAVAVSIRQ